MHHCFPILIINDLYYILCCVFAGMVHVGMGETDVNEWLSVLNVPPLARSTVKAREREMGPNFEAIAEDSCQKALHLEQAMSSENTRDRSGPVQLTASYDMGWTRRGSGRTYNSMSGHGSLIGQHSGKVIAYGSRITTCRYCEVAEREHREANPHHCRRNWNGSSKAMEASVGVELCQKTRSDQAELKTIVMDDDTTTLAHLRKDYDTDVTKWSDTSHAKKTLTNSLFKLGAKHKILTNNKNKVINYIRTCYGYVLAQHKGDVEGVQSGLRQIVPHMFGEHTACGQWCRHEREQADYRHRSLPRGHDLSDPGLREDLTNLLEIHARNANRLAPCGSTKANESFNNTMRSKNPKSRHYCSSESYSFRLGAATSQKNIGPGYVNQVLKKTSLSPSEAHHLRVLASLKKAEKRKERSGSPAFKKRRRELADTRGTKLAIAHVKEGTSYETSVDMSSTIVSIDSIPEYTPMPQLFALTANDEAELVYFDVETSGSGDGEPSSLCQISCVSSTQGQLNTYILPERPITSTVTRITHLTVHDSILCYRDKPVPTLSLREGIAELLQFLQKHLHPVVLVGHNAKSFDAIYLSRAMLSLQVEEDFKGCLLGYADTLLLFRELYPGRKSYSQSTLYTDLMGGTYDAHNALDDCTALHHLVEAQLPGNPQTRLLAHSVSLPSAVQHAAWLTARAENTATFNGLVTLKVMTQYMATKCGASGLQLAHLMTVYRRSGREGLQVLLSEKKNGHERVSSRSVVLDKLANHFDS